MVRKMQELEKSKQIDENDARFRDLREYAEKSIAKTERGLKERICFRMKVENHDKVKLNNSDLNNEMTKTNSIKVEMDTPQVKQKIAESTGLNFDDYINIAETQEKDIAIKMKEKLLRVLGNMAREFI